MAELKTYKQKVRYLLEKYPQARNSDGTLVAHYIKEFHRHLIQKNIDGDESIALKNIKHLPPLENIRRCRQIIQNDNEEFPPTDPEIAKARGIKEENWRTAEVREARDA